jgi:mono/diheme cytochrome c family protein
MLIQRVRMGISRLPRALVGVLVVLLALMIWRGTVVWQDWQQYRRVPRRIAAIRPGTIAWKQTLLPAQYEQANCGGCHQADLPQTPRLNHGRQLVAKYNCIGCHKLQGIDYPAMLGPDLTNVGTKLTREWIYKWLSEPRTLSDSDGNVTVDGVVAAPKMPKFQLNVPELRALSAYLSVQRAQSVEPYRISPQAIALVKSKGDAADQGQIRFNQRFCVTCHGLSVSRGGETKLIGGDIGPELTKIGSKVRPEWLVAWLRDPQRYLEHTRMPQYEWSDADLYAVSQYLMTRLTDSDLLKSVPELGAATEVEVEMGRRLFVEKGCAECHVIRGVIPQKDFAPDLSALAMVAGRDILEIDEPMKQRVPLHFLKGDVPRVDVRVAQVPRSMIAYVQAQITNPISINAHTRMPQFHMSQSDLDDLTTVLFSMVGDPIAGGPSNQLIVPRPRPVFHPSEPFGHLYQRYKCYVCHSINGYGGSLAPDLSFEGSRSRREWIVHFLKNPQTIRPALTVRMPDFNLSDQEATTLADYLSDGLRSQHVNSAVNELGYTPQMAARGKQLYEVKYECQSCHTLGSSGGYVGPSLDSAGDWLTPGWIEAWLRNPLILIPDTVEPRHSFTEGEIKDLTAYLLTLKQSPTMGSTPNESAGGQH